MNYYLGDEVTPVSVNIIPEPVRIREPVFRESTRSGPVSVTLAPSVSAPAPTVTVQPTPAPMPAPAMPTPVPNAPERSLPTFKRAPFQKSSPINWGSVPQVVEEDRPKPVIIPDIVELPPISNQGQIDTPPAPPEDNGIVVLEADEQTTKKGLVAALAIAAGIFLLSRG